MPDLTLFEALTLRPRQKQLDSVESQRGWFNLYKVRESFPGAWQQNVEVDLANVLTYAAVYACVTLISSDIGKLAPELVEQSAAGIWTKTTSPAFSPVLRKPNRYQTRIKFLETWVLSKLIHGNAYILKQRDNRDVVVALYVLDPTRVKVLVGQDGAVYYEVKRDTLSEQPLEQILVPASEIIHDMNAPLYHPLIGISPISACGLAAVLALKIQDNAGVFLDNGSSPGGFLSAPGAISDETAQRLKTYFDSNFSGANRGKVAVGGDGLTYQPLGMLNNRDMQIVEQLKWTAEQVCMAFHMPPYKIGLGQAPPYGNYAAVKQDYHDACLQPHIESIELLLDEGLGLTTVPGRTLGVELDADNLLRMDTPTLVDVAGKAIGSAAMAPNEARTRWLNLAPVAGGDTPYMQQQQFSLAALNARDQDQPFAKPTTPPPAAVPAPSDADEDDDVDAAGVRAALVGLFVKDALERIA